MSDDEYNFDYSDDENNADAPEEDDLTVKVQNAFYTAKGFKESDMPAAIAGFQEVLSLAGTNAEFVEWAFKSQKNIVKLLCRQRDFTAMLPAFKALLTSINAGAVTRNRAEKGINSILDLVSSVTTTAAPEGGSGAGAGGRGGAAGSHVLLEFYEVTLEALGRSTGNERLIFKTRLKLARLFFEAGQWERLETLLSSLMSGLQSTGGSGGSGGEDDRAKGTQLVELYALQIQMYEAMGDTKRMAEAHTAATALSRAAVVPPGTMGVIHECGGKLAMADRNWEGARVEFLDAFKAYGEAATSDRIVPSLKYMLLANMLAASGFNPFDSQEAKAYEREPSIAAMTQLNSAYLANDIAAFDPVIRKHSASLMGDPFIAMYLGDLLAIMRSQVLLVRVAPYKRVSLRYLADELTVSVSEVEALLVALILDGKLEGSIDQVDGTLLVRRAPKVSQSPATAGAGAAKPPPMQAKAGLGAGTTHAELEKLAHRIEGLVNTISAAHVSRSGNTGGGGMRLGGGARLGGGFGYGGYGDGGMGGMATMMAMMAGMR